MHFFESVNFGNFPFTHLSLTVWLLIALALFVWLIVGLIKYGPWAMRKPGR